MSFCTDKQIDKRVRGVNSQKSCFFYKAIQTFQNLVKFNKRLVFKIAKFRISGLYNTHRAFTLAEVLVTLAVIGVVAAMTIPGLVKDYQQNVNKKQFLKLYSDLSRAVTRMVTDNGGSLKGVFGASYAYSRDQLLPYLKVHSVESSIGDLYTGLTMKYLNGVTYTQSTRPGLMLETGATLWITSRNWDTCEYGGGQHGCIEIEMDVNGPKPPNQRGGDIFVVSVVESGLKPYWDNNDFCDPDGVEAGTGSGNGCSVFVLKGIPYQPK